MSPSIAVSESRVAGVLQDEVWGTSALAQPVAPETVLPAQRSWAMPGPLREDHQHVSTHGTRWALDPHGRQQQRTLDEALQELLAEWEQF
jgi:hypothetical protein